MEENRFRCEEGCYTVDDLKTILSVSRPTVYELLKKKEFAWKNLGRCGYRIPKATFDEWLMTKQN